MDTEITKNGPLGSVENNGSMSKDDKSLSLGRAGRCKENNQKKGTELKTTLIGSLSWRNPNVKFGGGGRSMGEDTETISKQ